MVRHDRPFSQSLESARDVNQFRYRSRTIELRANLCCWTFQAIAKLVIASEYLVQFNEDVRELTLSTRAELESHGYGTLQRPIE
jgi:hypothetical protein